MLIFDEFVKVLPNCKKPGTWFDLLNNNLAAAGILTKEQVCAFIAQCAHESADFNTLEENLNYSADRLLVVFPKYFKALTPDELQAYNRKPMNIANRVYGSRMGNGIEPTGDGFRYRGRGVIQLTGKNNYRSCSLAIYKDENILLNSPDLLLQPTDALKSALWFWSSNKLEQEKDFVKLTQKINGGQKGIEHRTEVYNKALKTITKV